LSFNLATMLHESVLADPDKPCVIIGDRTLTYAQVEHMSGLVAGNLLGLGLDPGSKVAVQLPNIPQFLFAYFIQTPAIGGVFLAGFLAPRASWLLGVIVGLVSAACYALLVFGFPLTIGATLPPTTDQAREVALSAFILSPVVGGFFAAGAAWYRRFLALTNPNRGKRGTQAPKQRPGDGRTRGGPASQKAGAKR